MDEQRRRTLPCPYCDFAISKDLITSRFNCPQCGRPVRVNLRFLMPLGTVIGVAVWVVWFCIDLSYGLSGWWVNPLIDVGLAMAILVLITLVSLLLPRELVARGYSEHQAVTTLDLGTRDEQDAANHSG